MTKLNRQPLFALFVILALALTACTDDQLRQCAVQSARLQLSIHSANTVTLKLVQAGKLKPGPALKIVNILAALNDAGDRFNVRVLEIQQRIEEAEDKTEKERLTAQARVELKPLFDDLLQLSDSLDKEGLLGIDDPETRDNISTAIAGARTALTLLGGFFK